MPLIELPRALEDYFAFAETEPTRRGRRFSITLPFHNGNKLERLQWWYHVSPSEEQMFEGHGMLVLRTRSIQRFCRHIERWLEINRLRLEGNEPIPRLRSHSTNHQAEVGRASQRQTQSQSGPGEHRVDERVAAVHQGKSPSREATPATSTDNAADDTAAVQELPAWPLIQAVNG